MYYSPVSRDYYEKKVNKFCEIYQSLLRVKNYSDFTVEQKEVFKKAMDILNDRIDELENILDDENICFFNPDKD